MRNACPRQGSDFAEWESNLLFSAGSLASIEMIKVACPMSTFPVDQLHSSLSSRSFRTLRWPNLLPDGIGQIAQLAAHKSVFSCHTTREGRTREQRDTWHAVFAPLLSVCAVLISIRVGLAGHAFPHSLFLAYFVDYPGEGEAEQRTEQAWLAKGSVMILTVLPPTQIL